MNAVWIGGVAGAVAVLLVAEAIEARWKRLPKMVASSGFIAVAIVAGATDTPYGRAVLLGLVLAWVGDLLLTFEHRGAFLGGLGVFLAGHLAYLIAFWVRGISFPLAILSASVVAAVAGVIWWWLAPHLVADMAGPVALYVVVIAAMVVGAVATSGFAADFRIVVGAVAFFVSDVAVARNRFVHAGFTNRLWGLPLYYLGQVLLALSVAG